jgi:hypothetical protein
LLLPFVVVITHEVDAFVTLEVLLWCLQHRGWIVLISNAVVHRGAPSMVQSLPGLRVGKKRGYMKGHCLSHNVWYAMIMLLTPDALRTRRMLSGDGVSYGWGLDSLVALAVKVDVSK